MTAKQVIKMLEADGWYFVRQNGSHKIYQHDEKGKVVVPFHGSKDLAIGTLKAILKTAGL
jgi:predicted RNA binding protein YcfA (HicA-like mRNA interferase family)